MTTIFGAKSTTDEVLDGIDLTGKRILVTGVSAGLGVETARALAAAWRAASSAPPAISTRRAPPPPRIPGHRTGRARPRLARQRPRRRRRAQCEGRQVRRRHRQCRRDGDAARQDRRRLRDPVRHQPSRPFRLRQPDRLADPRRRPAGEPGLGRATASRTSISTIPDFETTPYEPLARLWPLEDRQRPVRGRVRPPPQGPRRARRRRPPRRHRHRARPPSVARRDAGACRQSLTPSAKRARRPSSSSRSRRAPRPRSGPAWSPRPRRWAGAIARIATSPRSPKAAA